MNDALSDSFRADLMPRGFPYCDDFPSNEAEPLPPNTSIWDMHHGRLNGREMNMCVLDLYRGDDTLECG